MSSQNDKSYAGKFNIIATKQYANKIYNTANDTGSIPPEPDQGFLIQDNGFNILQDNGFPILYTS